MEGYQEKPALGPSVKDRKPTAIEWGLSLVAVTMGVLMLAGALGRSSSAPSWLGSFRPGLWPIAITQISLGAALLVRAQQNSPDETHRPAALRMAGLVLVLIGIVTVAIGLTIDFKGA